MDTGDVISIVVWVTLLVGFAWADRIALRIHRRKRELLRRSKARQAYELQREAARTPLGGAKR